MMKRVPIRLTILLLLALTLCVGASRAHAASAAELQRNAAQALKTLCAGNKAARVLRDKASAVLVFPNIIKAGFMFGGQLGEGVLFRRGTAAGYYSSIAGSYGFQAGIQKFGYALFFMNENALQYLDDSKGWEVGVGPSIVVVDEGFGKSITSTTLTHDVYAFIFSQKGLMGGLGVQGSKITKIEK